MNQQNRARLQEAHDILMEVHAELEMKMDNLADNSMEHLPVYEKLEEEFNTLDQIKDDLQELTEGGY